MRIWVKWAGNMIRAEAEQLTKRGAAFTMEGRRRRGRLRLRWFDMMKRNFARFGWEWSTRSMDGGVWGRQ